MVPQKSLPNGRAFEMEVFGVTEIVERAFRMPRLLGKKSSVQQIISYNWAMYAEALERASAYCHNPVSPQMAKTGLLWQAVKANLPRRVAGYSAPLNLYIAVERVALDWRHGIDGFFWWQGAFVSFDVSLVLKVGDELKANFLINPEDLEPDGLSILGKSIAELLKERSRFYRYEHRRTQKLPTVLE